MPTTPTDTRISKVGVALALYPSDETASMEIQRAPDSSGSPDTGNAETLDIVPPGTRTYVDIAPRGSTFHYRYRHVRTGANPSNWTRWLAASPVELPDVLPNVPDIQAISRWSTDIEFSPDGADSVQWTSGTLELAGGIQHSISSASAATYGNGTTFYIYWDPSVSETAFQDSSTFQDAVGDGIILIAVARTTSDGTGSASVQAIHGMSSFNAERIFAQTLAAIVADFGVVRAGRIDNASTGPTAGIRVSTGYSQPASWETFLDLPDEQMVFGGAKSPSTGTGIFQGLSTSGAYEHRVGDPSSTGESMHWDGSAFSAALKVGSLTLGQAYVGAFHSDTSTDSTSSTSYTSLRVINLDSGALHTDGALRIEGRIVFNNSANTKYIRFLFNGTELFEVTGGTAETMEFRVHFQNAGATNQNTTRGVFWRENTADTFVFDGSNVETDPGFGCKLAIQGKVDDSFDVVTVTDSFAEFLGAP